MVVKVEMCVACHMSEREGARDGRERERERIREESKIERWRRKK